MRRFAYLMTGFGAAVVLLLVVAAPAAAGEQKTSGALAAGTSTRQTFSVTTTGPIAVRLEWANPSARLRAYLLRRDANGVYQQVAAATGAEMPQVIVRDATPGRYRVRVSAAGANSDFTLWLRSPTRPPPDPRPGYATVMFGRSMIGNASNCTLRPGAVSLFAIADVLRDRGIAATSNATIELIGTCTAGNLYASWDQLASLRDGYGWTLTSRGKTGRLISTLTPAEQYDETCGSLEVFADHGFTRAWGMYGYPGGEPVASVQTGPVDDCFAYGRDYEPASNPYPLAAPYLASVYDILGGRCRNPALGCYLMPVKNSRWYTPPALLAAYANAGLDGTGRWQVLQWYLLVTGHSGSTTSTVPAWSCDSADPRDHWTNRPEMYCLTDMLWVIDHVSPAVTFTDPATLGALQGRDFTAPPAAANTAPLTRTGR